MLIERCISPGREYGEERIFNSARGPAPILVTGHCRIRWNLRLTGGPAQSLEEDHRDAESLHESWNYGHRTPVSPTDRSQSLRETSAFRALGLTLATPGAPVSSRGPVGP